MNYIQKLWNKIRLNSEYRTTKPNKYLFFYDSETSKKITETGRNIIDEYYKNTKNNNESL